MAEWHIFSSQWRSMGGAAGAIAPGAKFIRAQKLFLHQPECAGNDRDTHTY